MNVCVVCVHTHIYSYYWSCQFNSISLHCIYWVVCLKRNVNFLSVILCSVLIHGVRYCKHSHAHNTIIVNIREFQLWGGVIKLG